MNRSEFQDLMEKHYLSIRSINDTKGHDYAGDEDALANFKEQADEYGLTPEQVWGVFCGKHWKAIQTYVREGAVQSEPIEGRVHDMILYGFLLLGLIEERKAIGITVDPMPRVVMHDNKITP